MAEPCCVADQFCTAPANMDGAAAKARCTMCGQPVCLKCSTRRLVGKKRVRVCNDCQVDELDGGSDEVVMRRLRWLAGY